MRAMPVANLVSKVHNALPANGDRDMNLHPIRVNARMTGLLSSNAVAGV
jgi:hypothetical protein